jgi:hypothetical protein
MHGYQDVPRDGYPVKCVPPDWIVATGYKLEANDLQDVRQVCEKFGIEIPEEHRANSKSLPFQKG